MIPLNMIIFKMLMTRRLSCLCKEVIFVKILENDTKGEGLFIAVQQLFKENDHA